ESEKPGSARQDAVRSTSERRLAKKKRHEVVFFVKTANFCRPGGAALQRLAKRIGDRSTLNVFGIRLRLMRLIKPTRG
ncbi:MAG: hypothetical protein WCQ77_14290, partial [Planctomycetota bacterium]